MSHLLYCDGAARGNPGPAAIGYVLYGPDGAVIEELGGAIGDATNNVAEYQAVIAGLEAARRHGVQRLEVRLDSLLLVRQVSGEYRVKAAHLKPLRRKVAELLAGFESAGVAHVPRADNARADALANAALDEARS